MNGEEKKKKKNVLDDAHNPKTLLAGGSTENMAGAY